MKHIATSSSSLQHLIKSEPMSHRRMWLEGGMNEEQEWIKGEDEEGTKEDERTIEEGIKEEYT